MAIPLSFREAVDLAENLGDTLVMAGASPIFEVAGITKRLDGGPVLVFPQPAGYSGWRIVTNLLGNRRRLLSFLDTDEEQLKRKVISSVQNILSPEHVSSPACQEVVLKPRSLLEALPVLKQTRLDIGRVISGGVVLVQVVSPGDSSGEAPYNLSFHRILPSPSTSELTLSTLYDRHFFQVIREYRAANLDLPITINIGLSPSVLLMAAGGAMPQLRPPNGDELGAAGALQGAPVPLARAASVDAVCIADAEVVIEGTLLVSEKAHEEAWLTQAERGKKPVYFFPEFIGYQGVAGPAFRVKVTAVTHRRDPYYYTPLADSRESSLLGSVLTEASIYDLCRRIAPQVFVDCRALEAMKGQLGVVLQCRINNPRDASVPRRLIHAAMAAVKDLRLVVVVDEDVQIADADEVLWALTVRANVPQALQVDQPVPGGAGEGKWGIDCTVPWEKKQFCLRPVYESVGLSRWINEVD